MARPAEDAGADVVVEVARQRADLEPHLGDRPLQRRTARRAAASRTRRRRSTRARREPRSRARGRAGSGRRVRRVGDDGVEPRRQRRRQRLAQVLPDAPERERRSSSSASMNSSSRSSTSTTASSSMATPNCLAKRSSATDIRSSSPSRRIRRPVTRVRGVHREHAPELRLRRAVALVELDERLGRRLRNRRKAAAQPRDRSGSAIPRPPHPGRTSRRPQPPTRTVGALRR